MQRLLSGLLFILCVAGTLYGYQRSQAVHEAELAERAVAVRAAEDPVVKKSLQTARQARDRKDFNAALQQLQPLAEKGHAEAQYQLGRIFEMDSIDAMPTGRGTLGDAASDFENARIWYGKAADQGHLKAQSMLGNLYLLGVSGMRQSGVQVEEGLRLLREAAKEKEVNALRSLAEYYNNYGSTPIDAEEAARWYTEAAKQGDRDSLLILAAYYRTGQGVEKDIIQSWVWAVLAGMGQDAEKQLNAEQFEEVKRRVIEWRALYPAHDVARE